MPGPLRVRELTDEERMSLERMARSRMRRARACGARPRPLVLEPRRVGRCDRRGPRHLCPTVRHWLKRFNARGWPGWRRTFAGEAADLLGRAEWRGHRPPLTDPPTLGLPFACWTLDRLVAYLGEQGIAMRAAGSARSSCRRAQVAAGGDLVRRAGRSRLRAQKGAIEQLYTAPPRGSVVVCLDEMGPQAAKSYPAAARDQPAGPEAERARQEIDYGRRGTGYVFGALQPATARLHRDLRAPHHRQLGRLPERGRGWIDPRSSGSTPCSTTSTSTARPTCCCSAWPIRAGSSCSSPSTRPT